MPSPHDDVTPARQRVHALVFNAVTRGLHSVGEFVNLGSREALTAAIIEDLAANHATIHAHTTAVPPSTLAEVADRLHTIAGPHPDQGGSRTVITDRAGLHQLAATVDHRARTAHPFSADLLAYEELIPAMVGWRALLGTLATTGTATVIPAALMPPGWMIQVIAGWTLRTNLRADPDLGTVTITVDRVTMPGLEPTPGCTAATDPRLATLCRGPADYTVTYRDTDGNPLDTTDPVCSAHAWDLQRRAGHQNIAATVGPTVTADRP